jgi:hypothetical protein
MVNGEWVPEYAKNLIFGQLNTRRYGWLSGRNARKSVCCIIFPLIVNTAQTMAERALGAKVNVKKAPVQSN